MNIEFDSYKQKLNDLGVTIDDDNLRNYITAVMDFDYGLGLILEDLENLSNRQDIDEDEIEQARIFISGLKMRFQRPQSYTQLKKDIDISHIDADNIIERAEGLPTVKQNIKKQSIDTLINDIHGKYSKEE